MERSAATRENRRASRRTAPTDSRYQPGCSVRCLAGSARRHADRSCESRSSPHRSDARLHPGGGRRDGALHRAPAVDPGDYLPYRQVGAVGWVLVQTHVTLYRSLHTMLSAFLVSLAIAIASSVSGGGPAAPASVSGGGPAAPASVSGGGPAAPASVSGGGPAAPASSDSVSGGGPA
jgi:hypothetical protein